jgi:hypothetical protein
VSDLRRSRAAGLVGTIRGRLGALRLVPRALGAATAVEVGLHRTPLPRLAARLGVPLGLDASPDRHGFQSETQFGTDEVRRAMAATAFVLRRWPAHDTCLRRSLVTGHLLRAKGPQLRLGVGPGEPGPVAHAWIELPGGTCIAGPSEGMLPLLAKGASSPG